MPVLGATLVREQHELLRADAIGVHVDDELEAHVLEPAQTEVRDLDLFALVRREHDAGLVEHGRCPLARFGRGQGLPELPFVADWSSFTTRLPHTPVILGCAPTVEPQMSREGAT